MKVDATFLRSKVARRIFLSFVLSALLPIGLLAFLAFDQVTEQLHRQTERRLHRESKSLGMSLHERLSLLEAELRLAGDLLGRSAGDSTQSASIRKTERLARRFNAMALVGQGGEVTDLMGAISDMPTPSAEGWDHLHSGAGLVFSRPTTDLRGRIFVSVALNPSHPEEGLLVGEANSDEFWDLGVAETSHLCVLNASRQPLFCPSPINTEALLNAIAPEVSKATSARVRWKNAGKGHVAAYWNLFLKPSFHVPSWTIVLSELEADAFAPLERFRRMFPLVVALALFVVVFLSLGQIRRYLVPLEKLKKGTQRLSGQDFHTPVVIDSNDEFEDLADSFNSMTARLERQFKTLGTLAEIDQIILSALDKDYIVETLLTRMRDVVACDFVCVALADDDTPNTFVTNISDASGILREQAGSVILQPEDQTSLCRTSAHILIETGEHQPNYLTPLVRLGARHCLVLPVIIKDALSAVIVAGYRGDPALSNRELTQVRELADRAAVALSNAAWEEKLYQQAHYDALTDLPNRVLLRDRLEQAIARAQRNHTQVAVIFFDLDQFKRVNDSLGHAAGDLLLKQTAQRLSSELREIDTVGRFGGDEYVILVSDLCADEDVGAVISAMSEGILAAVKAPLELDGNEVHVTASIGIAVYPHDGNNVDDLLKQADTAMYHAKDQGRATYAFYAHDLNVAALERLDIENSLRRALERNELTLYYQPQVNVRTGRVIGAEALVRWIHPEWGLVSPTKFIPIAEETGLIKSIGKWILRTACEQKRDWEARGFQSIKLAVNLSARQFDAGDIVATLTDILQETGTRVDTLELEVTEGILMKDMEEAVQTLNTLHGMGIGLAIDDFGTGYSSLAYLARFPIHCLKIDQSFVRELGKNDHVGSIVAAIIALAHSLNMNVVAEGVETESQLELLRAQGCDEVQGYLFGHPLPAPVFEKLLRQRNGVAAATANECATVKM